jgi:hypothetical protein
MIFPFLPRNDVEVMKNLLRMPWTVLRESAPGEKRRTDRFSSLGLKKVASGMDVQATAREWV